MARGSIWNGVSEANHCTCVEEADGYGAEQSMEHLAQNYTIAEARPDRRAASSDEVQVQAAVPVFGALAV